MTKITFDCDRCGKLVVGMHTATGTAGFYDVSRGKAWADYALSEPEQPRAEHFVCDECVQAMPLYRQTYGGRDCGEECR